MYLRIQYRPTGISAILDAEMLCPASHNRRWGADHVIMVPASPENKTKDTLWGPETVASHSA